MGAAEPWEKVTEGESRATLDRGLPCWDSGRMDKRRIHEPLDEIESRETSEMGCVQSPCRMNECRRRALGGVTCGGAVAWLAGRAARIMLEVVELGGGRETSRSGSAGAGAAELAIWPWSVGSRRLLDAGREPLAASAGWATTRPVMATAMLVPAPMSCYEGGKVCQPVNSQTSIFASLLVCLLPTGTGTETGRV